MSPNLSPAYTFRPELLKAAPWPPVRLGLVPDILK